MSKDTNANGPKKIWVSKSQIIPIGDILSWKRIGLSRYLDSGCSRHMVSERSIFLDLKAVEGGAVAFGGMGRGKITGISKIVIPSLASINKVLYVEGQKYNLLSISQLCDSGYIVSFNKDQCIVNTKDGKFFLLLDNTIIYMRFF